MSGTAPGSKWWGWGAADRDSELSPLVLELLRSELRATEGTPPVDLAAVRLPDPRSLPDAVVQAAGEGSVLTSDEDRLRRAAGRSYPDLIRLRSGELADAPDAVLLPASA